MSRNSHILILDAGFKQVDGLLIDLGALNRHTPAEEGPRERK